MRKRGSQPRAISQVEPPGRTDDGCRAIVPPAATIASIRGGRTLGDNDKVVAAELVTGSEKAPAHRLGLSHSTVKHQLANARSKVGEDTTAQLVWILAPRLPEPKGAAQADG